MTALPPESAHTEFLDRFRARDLDGVVALYTDDASFVGFDGAVVTGKAAVRAAFEALFAQIGPNCTIELTTRYAVPNGDIALLSNTWHIGGTAADGSPLDLGGQTTEVVRRQADGRWLYVIDHPLGGQ
ncbi:MAG: SgcJ/EcaC family oxidoreductase [Gammaproteobacteria bacterium]